MTGYFLIDTRYRRPKTIARSTIRQGNTIVRMVLAVGACALVNILVFRSDTSSTLAIGHRKLHGHVVSTLTLYPL